MMKNAILTIDGRHLGVRIVNTYSDKSGRIYQYMIDYHGDFEMNGVVFTGRTTMIVPAASVRIEDHFGVE